MLITIADSLLDRAHIIKSSIETWDRHLLMPFRAKIKHDPGIKMSKQKNEQF